MASNNSLTNWMADATAILRGGNGDASSAGVNEQLIGLVEELRQLQAVNQAQIDTLKANTPAVSQSSGSKSEGSIGSVITSATESFLGFGLGLGPLVSGLVSLFGGGGGGASGGPPPLVPYIAPPSIRAAGGISAASPAAFAVDTAAGGAPRAVTQVAPQITVQVQAMDSRSFLDHSNEIAMAVRQAMLESNVLSDVIREA